MQTLHVITACSRLGQLPALALGFFNFLPKDHSLPFKVRWHIAFQNTAQPDPHGCVKFNELIDLIPSRDWIWILDDDNRIHIKFFELLSDYFEFANTKAVDAFVFGQNRFDALGDLEAAPENMRVGRVDTAQVVFRKKLLNGLRFKENSKVADGEFYEALYKSAPDRFVFVKQLATYWNGGLK